MKKGFLLLLTIGFFLSLTSLSLWWLWAARTVVGTAIAVLGLTTAVLPYTLIQHHRRTSITLILVALAIIIGIFWAAPDGRPAAGSPVSHQFTTDATFPRYSFANLIPEEEQFNLGWRVMPYADPILTPEQAKQAAIPTFILYEEMAQDPHFTRLGTVTGWAYNELIGRPFNKGHYYLYTPPNQSTEPLPAIIFLHGAAGNFKSYFWLWSKLAEQESYIIIAPSFGFGNWRQEGGVTAVLNALDHASSLTNIDPNHIYLAGLSNGGLGVSLTADVQPDRFHGLIFISPALATEITDHEPFLNNWRNKPILLITGAEDKRIPISYIQSHLAIWQQHNLPLTTAIYANEDHFLFFAQANTVLADISQWLDEN